MQEPVTVVRVSKEFRELVDKTAPRMVRVRKRKKPKKVPADVPRRNAKMLAKLKKTRIYKMKRKLKLSRGKNKG